MSGRVLPAAVEGLMCHCMVRSLPAIAKHFAGRCRCLVCVRREVISVCGLEAVPGRHGAADERRCSSSAAAAVSSRRTGD